MTAVPGASSRPVRSLAVALLLVASFGCEPVRPIPNRRGEVGGRYFEFEADGWITRARGDAFWIARGQREYGTFRLTEGEAKKLWKLVERAAVDERAPSRRPADGEDARYRFTLLVPGRKKALPHTVELLGAEVGRDDDLVALVTYEARLVKKYTGKKPSF